MLETGYKNGGDNSPYGNGFRLDGDINWLGSGGVLGVPTPKIRFEPILSERFRTGVIMSLSGGYVENGVNRDGHNVDRDLREVMVEREWEEKRLE